MNELKMIAAVIIAMTALIGCSSKSPTTGDFMRMHAADEKATGVDQKQLAKNWDHGSELKKSGEKLVKHGEELVKSGDKDMMTGKNEIEQGNKDIIEGTKLAQESERMFHEKYPELKLDLK
ncbi:hypothetical protein [Sulfuricurvum sp.]|uniref:hypothetical protein n=1 Tax=Sulfuricurvum sp. TaxID=2025608 RepID=UPI002E2F0E72|nr:hypothetical protein [Sulfuricurvum sp.]HEX5329225.1 hypothetical protein [Sulfuricurvum sp.]